MMSGKRHTVLIVDDAKTNRAVLGAILQDTYDTVKAEDGLSALKILREDPSRISLVLLDIVMPGLDGFGVLKEMMADPVLAEIPVIVATSLTESESEVEALQAGAVDFVVKPYIPEVIRTRVANVVTRLELDQLKLEHIAQKEREAQQRDMLQMLENMDCGVTLIEVKDGTVSKVQFNDRLLELRNLTAEQYTSTVVSFAAKGVYPDDVAKLQAVYDSMLTDGDAESCTFRSRKKDGSYLWLRFVVRDYDFRNGVKRFIGTLIDVDAETRTREELRFRADHDYLTGLLNMTAFYEGSRRLIDEDDSASYTVARFNIEQLSVVNQLYGKDMGDRFIVAVGTALKGNLPEGALLGRLESDHFAVFMRSELFDVEALLSFVDKEIDGIGIDHHVIISVGIYIVDDNSLPTDQMCDRANFALQRIKGDYSTHYAYFDQNVHESMMYEQWVRDVMQEALDAEEFELFYQPVYSIAKQRFVSAEALVRWNRPGEGYITPGDFVPIFEKNGFIAELDAYMWNHVCAYLADRAKRGLPDLPISVNVSRMSTYNDNLVNDIVELVSHYDIDRSLIRFEITESAYSDNPNQLISVVENLQKNGFSVLMDDFGSGYSSLNTLKDIPVDILKIDMVFLEGFDSNSRTGNIITSVVRLARWLNIPTIAEGVESGEQLSFLRSVGCDMIQGYYFSKPIPQSEFEVLTQGSHVIDALDTPFDSPDLNILMGGSSTIDYIFDRFFGFCGIFAYHDGLVEPIRINKRFAAEIPTKIPGLFSASNDMLSYLGESYHESVKKACTEALENVVKTSVLYRGDFEGFGKLTVMSEIIPLQDNTDDSLLLITFETLDTYPYGLSSQMIDLLNAIPAPFVLSSREECRVIAANPAAEKILGKHHSELLDSRCYGAIFGRKIPCVKCSALAKDKHNCSVYGSLLGTDGMSYKVIGRTLPFMSEDMCLTTLEPDSDGLLQSRLIDDEALDRFADFADHFASGIMLIELLENSSPHAIYVNERFASMLECSTGDLLDNLNLDFYAHLDPADIPTFKEYIESGLWPDEPVPLRVRGVSDTMAWVGMTGSPLPVEGRKLIILAFDDINHLQEERHRLSVLGKELSLVSSDSACVFWEYNPYQDLMIVTSPSARILECEEFVPHASVAFVDEGIVSEDTAKSFTGALEAIKRGKTIRGARFKLHVRDLQEYRWFEMTSTRLSRPDDLIAVVCMMRDITNLVERESKYSTLNDELIVRSDDSIIVTRVDVSSGEIVTSPSNLSFLPGLSDAFTLDTFVARLMRACSESDEHIEAHTKHLGRSGLLEAFDRGKDVVEEMISLKVDGMHNGWFQASAHLIKNPDNDHVEAYCMLFDKDLEVIRSEVMDAMSDCLFEYMAVVDVDNNRFRILEKSVSESIVPVSPSDDFGETINEFIDAFVVKGQRESLKRDWSLPTIVSAVQERGKYSVVYNVSQTEGTTQTKIVVAFRFSESHSMLCQMRFDVSGSTLLAD